VRLDRLKEHFGDRVEIEWKAFMLRTGPRDWERQDFLNYTQSWMRPKEMEPELDFTVWSTDDPQPHSSIEAHVAFKVLEELAPDNAKAFHDRIMRAYFVENRDISNAELLTGFAVDVGVDADAFNEAMVARGEAMTELVFEEHNSAVSQNVTGIPTVVFEDQYVVSGAQSLETYVDVVEKIEKFFESEAAEET